ncbi:MAG: hypothetical protein LBU53_01115 [Zoogloeaceae bacterium]|nr:hypothetical protein [Zoogloeaceae bacterium]
MTASDTNYANYRGVGDLSTFICLFELELTGIPGNGGTAAIVRPKSPAELLVYEIQTTPVDMWPTMVLRVSPRVEAVSWSESQDGATCSVESVPDSKRGHLSLSSRIKSSVMAGYVDDVLKVVDFCTLESWEISAEISILPRGTTGSVSGVSGEGSASFDFAVPVVASFDMTCHRTTFIGDEKVLSYDTIDSGEDMLEIPSVLTTSWNDSLWTGVFSYVVAMSNTDVSKWLNPRVTGSVFGESFTGTSDVIWCVANRLQADMLIGHLSLNSHSWNSTGYIVRVIDHTSFPLFMYCGSVTPGVIKLAWARRGEFGDVIVDNVVRTIGQATSDGTPPHTLPTLQRNISWCPP